MSHLPSSTTVATLASLRVVHAVTIVDGGLEWREHPDPIPGDSELLVAVRAAGLNGADMMQRRGLYPAPPGSPSDIPGMELAGTVAAIGAGVTRFKVGDRVMAIVGGGGQAELATVHERVALPVPDGLPWPEAGGFPEVFTTAHDAMFTQCGLTLGDRVLVHGAAGGVGIAAVQLAASAGARVVATVRDASLRDRVAEIGAPNLNGDLAALAIGGRIAVIGVGGGARAEIDLLALMGKRGRIHGSTLRARPLEAKADAARGVEQSVLPLLQVGSLQVPIADTFAMAEAEAAYDRFTAGGKLGKIVLVND